MEEDLQPCRDEVFSISGPALQCPAAFGADGADAASRTGREPFPEQYFIASDEERESDCPVGDGPAYYCIGSDSDAEDCE
eukprot:3360407-Alexandrium_andersonii.AAC.1